MNKTLALLSGLVTMALGAGTALAGGSSGSIGVGAEYQLNGILNQNATGQDVSLGGLSGNYDMGKFHFGAFLGFVDHGRTDDTTVDLGGRFYYHLHSTAMSDFGIGGQVGVAFVGDGDANTNNDVLVFFEPGVQIRAFIASNVALSFSAGITIGTDDANGFAISGQPTGVAGVHYYFF